MEMVTLPSNTDRLVAALERIEKRLAVLAMALMPLEENRPQKSSWAEWVYKEARYALRALEEEEDV